MNDNLFQDPFSFELDPDGSWTKKTDWEMFLRSKNSKGEPFVHSFLRYAIEDLNNCFEKLIKHDLQGSIQEVAGRKATRDQEDGEEIPTGDLQDEGGCTL